MEWGFRILGLEYLKCSLVQMWVWVVWIRIVPQGVFTLPSPPCLPFPCLLDPQDLTFPPPLHLLHSPSRTVSNNSLTDSIYISPNGSHMQYDLIGYMIITNITSKSNRKNKCWGNVSSIFRPHFLSQIQQFSRKHGLILVYVSVKM